MRRFLALILALAMTLSAVMPSVALAYDSADTSGSSSITEQSSEASSEEASASKSSASEPEPEPEQPAPEAEPEDEPEQPAPEAEPEQSGDAESEPESSKDGSLYADTSESAPEEAPVLRQHTLRSTLKTVDGVRYQVTVAYDDTAEIPKGTRLSIVELNQELSEQEQKLPENQKRPYKTEEFVTEKALEQESFDLLQGLEVRDKDLVLFTKFLDLELKKDGRTIQPKSAVTVTVETDVVEEGASDALEVALYNAQATLDWQKERKKLEEEQQKKIKSGKLKEEDAKRFPEKVYTTMLLTNETQKKKGVKLSFEAEELARMGVCAVGGELKTWKHKGEQVSVFGPRSLETDVKRTSMKTPKDGLEKMGGFSVELKEKEKPDYDVTFWVGRRPNASAVETQADDGEDAGVAAYSLKDGKTKKELLTPEDDAPAAIEAGDKIGLVWDTGLRDRTLEAEQVTLSGLLPKRAHVETNDMLWRYSRPEALSEDVQQGDAATLAAYDISIENRGAEYQPEADNPVTVRIQAAGIDKHKKLQVWHLVENDAVEVIENFQVHGDTISFEADSFSVYLVVQITKEQVLTASDGNAYKITVTYGSDAGIPEDAELQVSELDAEGADYQKYVKKAAKKLGRKQDQLAFAHAFDIALVNPESGEHYQPTKPLKVSVELLSENVKQGDSVDVVHFPGTYTENPSEGDESGEIVNGESAEEIQAAVVDGVVEFESSGFSVYVLAKTVLVETLTASDGNTYQITVTYDDTARLPENTVLHVEEVTQESADFMPYLEQVSEGLDRALDTFTYARFFDISLVSGEDYTLHYQPKTEVEVSIRLIDTPEETVDALQVLHIGDDETIDVMDATAKGNALTFKTSSFSIYPVIDGDHGDNARLAYTFWYYNAEADEYQQIVTQYFRYKDVHPAEGDPATIYEPAIPGNGSEGGVSIFDGWHIGTLNGYTVDMTPTTTTIADLNTQLQGFAENDFVEGTVFHIVAKLKDAYYITYTDTNPLNILKTQLVIKNQSGDTLFSPDSTVRPTRNGEDLMGWKVDSEASDPNATLYEAGGSYPISGNITLVPVIQGGHWLVFDDNDQVDDGSGHMVSGGASFTPAAFYMNSSREQEPTERPADPTWDGYVFDNWYADPACTIPFTFGELLEQDTTVYAHWTPGPSAYTVLIWKQKSTDSPNAADDDKTYDFYRSFSLGVDSNGDPDGSIKTGDLVYLDEQYTRIYGESGTSSDTDKQYFKFNDNKTPDYIIVKASGSVLNVYYDRVTMTMNFYTWQNGSSYVYTPTTSETGALYGYVDGYVPISKAAGSDGIHSYSYSPTYNATTGDTGTQYGIIDGEYQELTATPVYSFTRNRYDETNDTGDGTTQYALINNHYVELTRNTRTHYYPTTGTRYTVANDDHDNDPQKVGFKNGNQISVYASVTGFGSEWYDRANILEHNLLHRYDGAVFTTASATASDIEYIGSVYYLNNDNSGIIYGLDSTDGETYFPVRMETEVYWTVNGVEYDGQRYIQYGTPITYDGQRYERTGGTSVYDYTYAATDAQTSGLYGEDERGGYVQLTRSANPDYYIYSYNGNTYTGMRYLEGDVRPVVYSGNLYVKGSSGFSQASTDGDDRYGLDGNGAYRLLQHKVTYPDIWQYTDSNGELKTYPSSAQRYTREEKAGTSWQIYKSYTGLYGSSLGTYGYEWPEKIEGVSYNWYYNGHGAGGNFGTGRQDTDGDGIYDYSSYSQGWWGIIYNYIDYQEGQTSGSRMTLKTTFEPLEGQLTRAFYGKHEDNQTDEVRFILEKPDGTYPDPDTASDADRAYITTVPLASGSNGFYINDKFAGYHASEYRTRNNQDNRWTDWASAGDKQQDGYYGTWNNYTNKTDSVSMNKKLEIRYARTGYKFNYFTNNASNQIISKTVKYGASLAGYGSQSPGQRTGYYFVGWFADDAFTRPAFFDEAEYNAYIAANGEGTASLFKEMPDHNETVYGYWREERTRVVIVPGSSDVHMGSQAQSFRLNYGERISGSQLESATRLGYVLDGWYTDENFTNRFLFSTPVISGITGVSSDYQTSTRWTATRVLYHDDDEAYANVRNIITLYAKWNVDTSLQGIKVIYDAGEAARYDTMGSLITKIPVDSLLYQSGSMAVVGAPPEDYNDLFVFDYWEAVDADGHVLTMKDNEGNDITQLQTGTVFSVDLDDDEYASKTTNPDDPSQVLLRTIKLRAKYHTSDQASRYTHITYDGDEFARSEYPSGTLTVHGKTKDGQDQYTVTLDTRINDTVVLPGEDDFYLEGYKLVGWSFFPGSYEQQEQRLTAYNNDPANSQNQLVNFGVSQKVAADQLAQGAVNTGANKLYAMWQPKNYKVTVKQVVETGVPVTSFAYQYRSGVENSMPSVYQTETLYGDAQARYTTLTANSTQKLEYYDRVGHVFQIRTPDNANGTDYAVRITAYVTLDNGTREAIDPQTVGEYSSYQIKGDITITYTYVLKVDVKLVKWNLKTNSGLSGSKFTLTPVEWDGDTSRWLEIGDPTEFTLNHTDKIKLLEGIYRVDETQIPNHYAPLGVQLLLTVKKAEDFGLALMNGGAVSSRIAALSATGDDGGNGKKHTLTLYDRPLQTITVQKTVEINPSLTSTEKYTFTAHITLEGADLGDFNTGADTTNGAGYIEFRLGNNESRALSIPWGAVITLTENQPLSAGCYLKSVTSAPAVTDTAPEANIISFTAEEDSTVTFTNIRPICKIVDNGTEQPFTTLSAALTYARDHMGGTATIEMLVDYTMPDSDNVELSDSATISLTGGATGTVSDNITLTTAHSGTYQYSNSGNATITRGFNNGHMFKVAGSLTLDQITLDGNKGTYTGDKGAAVRVEGANASLELNDGAVIRNSKTNDNAKGGAIWVGSGGSMTTSGTIQDCETSSEQRGGAIYLESGSSGTMTGGSITGCYSGEGAAVYVSGDSNKPSHFDMSGGSITGNTSDRGAVGSNGSNAKLNFSGSPEIYDNISNGQQKNIVLSKDSNTIINVTATMTALTKKIGVYDATATGNHRNAGELFGSHDSSVTGDFSVFKNDLNPELYGVAAPNDKMRWCGLRVETYKYNDLGYGTATLLDTGAYLFPENQDPETPVEVDTILTDLQTRYPGKFSAPDGYKMDTAVYGETREVVSIYADGRFNVRTVKNDGVQENILAISSDSNHDPIYCPDSTLRIYYYETDSLLPVLAQKIWIAPEKQLTANENVTVGISVNNGSTTMYSDSRKIAGSQTITSVTKDSHAIIGNQSTSTAWAKLVYVPEQASYTISETVSPALTVQDDEGVWDASKSNVNLTNNVWVEVDDGNWESGYIKLPCVSQYDDAKDFYHMVLYFESIDHIRYRSEVTLKSEKKVDVNTNGTTYYIPVRLPKNVPYCALSLPQSNLHKGVGNVAKYNGETYYGIHMDAGTPHLPRYTQSGVFDDGKPSDQGGAIIFKDVEFVRSLPDDSSTRVVVADDAVQSYSLKVYTPKLFSVTNTFVPDLQVTAYKYEKGKLSEAEQFQTRKYRMNSNGTFTPVETILTQLNISAPEGYVYDTSVLGSLRRVISVAYPFSYRVAQYDYPQNSGGFYTLSDLTNGGPLKVYYRKSENRQPLVVRKAWSSDAETQAQKALNSELSFTVNGNANIYDTNVGGTPNGTLQSTGTYESTVGGTTTQVSEWGRLVYVPRADSYTVAEDPSSLTVKDAANAENSEYGAFLPETTSQDGQWITLSDASTETAYVHLYRDTTQLSYFDNATSITLTYKDLDGVVYETTSAFDPTTIENKKDTYIQIKLPKNVDYDTLELLPMVTATQEPKNNSDGSRIWGVRIGANETQYNQVNYKTGNRQICGEMYFTSAPPAGTPSGSIIQFSSSSVKVSATNITITNTFKRSFTVRKEWVDVSDSEKANLEATVQLYKVTGTGTITIPPYVTQADATAMQQTLTTSGYTVAPVPGTLKLNAAKSWTDTFTDLDPDADYFAVETQVTDTKRTPDTSDDEAVTKYVASYSYNQAAGSLTITNGDYIARVSGDGGTTWTYHQYLIHTGTGTEQGAFDKANELNAESVIIETLRRGTYTTTIGGAQSTVDDTNGRYTLSENSSVSFNKAVTKAVTLRTTQDQCWNSGTAKFRSTIIRGSSNKASLFTVPTGKSFTTENIVIDGGAKLDTSNASDWDNTTTVTIGTGGVKVSVSGGIVNVENKGSLDVGAGSTLQDSVVEGKDHDGGAVYVASGGSFAIEGEIKKCASILGKGGGVYLASAMNLSTAADNARAVVSYCKAANQSSGNGGGIYIGGNANSVTEIKYIDFDHCVACGKNSSDGGAGLYVTAGKMTVEYCDFTDNSSPFKNAAGIFHYNTDKAASTTVNHCNFTRCKATGNNTGNSGGAMETDTTTVNIAHCNFTECQSTKNGGAVNIYNTTDNNGTVTVDDCVFVDCKAIGTDGGALRLNIKTVTASITDCQFTRCKANNGGAIASTNQNISNTTATITISGSKTKFENNEAVVTGGAIYLLQGTLSFSDGEIKSCVAPNGGGIYQAGGTCDYNSGTIEGCMATKSSDGYGGGFYLKNGIFNLKGGTISQCKSVGAGGGIYLGGGSFSFTAGSVKECVGKTGGGIYANVSGDVPISASGEAIVDCEARNVTITSTPENGVTTYTATTAADFAEANKGGGIYLSKGNVTLTNATIKGCKANTGGGIYLGGGKLNINNDGGNGVTIQGNTAEAQITGDRATGGNGGGIYLGDGSMTIESLAVIKGNAATASKPSADSGKVVGAGGGVYMGGDNKTLTLHGTIGGTDSADQNTASKGGGIYQAKGTLNMESTAKVIGNKANGDGGGIYLGGGTLELKAGTIKANEAKADTSGSEGNGGGIYLGSGDFKFSDGTIGGTNSADANKAVNGGGLYQGGGTMTMSGGYIRGNTAEAGTVGDSADGGLGGGIYLGGGSFTLRSGEVGVERDEENPQGLADGGNQARKGGGLYVGNGTSSADNDLTKAHIEGGVIGGNYATEVAGGGGIAIGGEFVRLYFSGNIQVWGNTMTPNSTYPLQTRCDVCLNVDSNDVIRTTSTGLIDDSHIGVYVPDDKVQSGQNAGKELHRDLHGTTDLPFGTFDSSGNGDKCLERFINNRSGYSGLAYQGYEYYYGVRKPEEEDPDHTHYIYWASYICEITDEEGNLLFTNDKATAPALYQYLGKHGAFEALCNHQQLYKKDKSLYTGKYCVRMLDFNYELHWNETLRVPANVDVTLMMAKDDDNNLPAAKREPAVYHDKFNGCTTIKRGRCTSHPMFTTEANSKFTIQCAIIDGGAVFDADGQCTDGKVGVDGALIKAGDDVTLGNKATLQNSVIKKAGNNHYGAAVWYDGPGTFTMDRGSKIQRCYATGDSCGGAVLYVNNANAEVNFAAPSEADQISNCTATNGLVYVQNGTLNLTGAFRGADDPADPGSSGSSGAPTVVNIKDCKSKYGGLAYVNGGTLNLNGTVTRFKAAYTENDAEKDGDGGVAYVSNGGKLNVGGTVSNCTAANGGAFCVKSGTLNLKNTISDCTATFGGAVYVDGGTLKLQHADGVHTLITGCEASKNGGAVYVSGNGKLNMTETTLTEEDGIKNCHARDGAGGAIYTNGANPEITISAGTVSENTATVGSGGAVRMNSGGKMTVSGSALFDQNRTAGKNDKFGGAISLKKGSIEVSGGTFSNNEATGDGKAYGGAIYVSANCTLTLKGGKFTGNTAKTDGACIYLAPLDPNPNIANSVPAKLELQGAPEFGTDVTGSTTETADDANTVTKTDYVSKKNGQAEVYPGGKVRQDIYLAEDGTVPQSIVVTGDLVKEDGTYIGSETIWIWADSDKHYQQLMPFATPGTNVTFYAKTSDTDTVPEGQYDAAHLKAFRNARNDDETENATDTWLYGTLEGDTQGCIHWTGVAGFGKVILKKVDSSYAPVNEKSFTIYRGTSTTAYTPKGGTELSDLHSGQSGCFFIGTLPYGWYIVKEEDPEKYFYIILDSSGTYGTLYTDNDGKDKTKVGGYTQRSEAEAEAYARYTALKAASH